MIPDLITALITALRADRNVADIADVRVYGDHVPDADTSFMPRACVVIQSAGSPNSIGSGFQEYGDRRVDVRTYGTTPFEADTLFRTVYLVLKNLTREVHARALIHWVKPVSGRSLLREPDTDWPFAFSTWHVLMSEIEVV